MAVAHHPPADAFPVRPIAIAHETAVAVTLDEFAACGLDRARNASSASAAAFPQLFDASGIMAPVPALRRVYAVEADALALDVDRP
jgi:hypothetical protein